MVNTDEMKRLVNSAAEVLYLTHRASAAHLSRRLDISPRDAAALMEELVKQGLIAHDDAAGRFLVNLHNLRLLLLRQSRQTDIERIVSFAKDAAAGRGYVTSEELCDWMTALEVEAGAAQEAVVETGSADVEDMVLAALQESGNEEERILRRLAEEGIQVIRGEDVAAFENRKEH